MNVQKVKNATKLFFTGERYRYLQVILEKCLIYVKAKIASVFPKLFLHKVKIS